MNMLIVLCPLMLMPDRLRNASSNHVPPGRPPQIVEQSAGCLRLLASFFPRFTEIDDLFAATVKDELGQLRGSVLLFNRASAPSALDQVPQIAMERQHTAQTILGGSQ